MKKIFIKFICILSIMMAFPGCFTQHYPENASDLEYPIVYGLAEDTKDGYYVNGHVLLEEEIIKYKPDYKSGDYSGKHLVITARIRKETNDDCTSPTGEIVQCRQGESNYFYDIKSIEEKNI